MRGGGDHGSILDGAQSPITANIHNPNGTTRKDGNEGEFTKCPTRTPSLRALK